MLYEGIRLNNVNQYDYILTGDLCSLSGYITFDQTVFDNTVFECGDGRNLKVLIAKICFIKSAVLENISQLAQIF